MSVHPFEQVTRVMDPVRGYRSMATAPRDGTVIEVKCSYGIAPWYGLFSWTDEALAYTSGPGRGPTRIEKIKTQPGWYRPDRPGGIHAEHTCEWRPYQKPVDRYVDPTGGAQEQSSYWLRAVARQHGVELAQLMPAETVRATPKPARPTVLERVRAWIAGLL